MNKEYLCPYEDIECDKLNTATMTTLTPCTQCNHYNDGVIFKKLDPVKKKLSIGFITTNLEQFKEFKKDNRHHMIFIINDSHAMFGLHFDLILNGDDWQDVNKTVIADAYSRFVK